MGRRTVRHRRTAVDVAPPVNVLHSRATVDAAGHLPPTATFSRTASSHMLFFGTDDVATSKKTEEAPEDAEAVPQKEDDKESKEWKDLCKLARDAFHVYFTDDSKTQLSTFSMIKQEKKKRIHTKVNGTMPYLTAYLTKLQLPAPFVNVILFTEASFRGIAQVRASVGEFNYMFNGLNQLDIFSCSTSLGVLPKQPSHRLVYIGWHVRSVDASSYAWHHSHRCRKSSRPVDGL